MALGQGQLWDTKLLPHPQLDVCLPMGLALTFMIWPIGQKVANREVWLVLRCQAVSL